MYGKGCFVLIVSFFVFEINNLDTRWVQHDTDASTNGLRRQVASKSASDNTIGSMGAANLSPGDAELVAKLVSSRSPGNKGNLLSEVKFNIFSGVNALDLDERNGVFLVSETSLESKNGSVNVKSR
jgi:hypothetical protein